MCFFSLADISGLAVVDVSGGVAMDLQFAASISASVFLETEDDKSAFLEAVVDLLEEDDEGLLWVAMINS